MKSDSCVVLLSGGLDSTTLLALALEEFDRVMALTLFYKQRHVREIEAAMEVAKYYKVLHRVVDISNISPLIQGSALTSDDIDVPEGHYTDSTMRVTVVPGRNTIMLSIAYGCALSMNFTSVGISVHSGDHPVYADTRPIFIDAMRKVFAVGDYQLVEIWTPFVNESKVGIVREGNRLGVPWELTWTCYKGEDVSCGSCGSCRERVKAFIENRLIDPITYAGGWERAVRVAESELPIV